MEVFLSDGGIKLEELKGGREMRCERFHRYCGKSFVSNKFGVI